MSLAQSCNSGNAPGLALRANYGLGIEYRKLAKVPVVVMKRKKVHTYGLFTCLNPGLKELDCHRRPQTNSMLHRWVGVCEKGFG